MIKTDKNEIIDFIITEITETALAVRRKACSEEEQQSYAQLKQLSEQTRDVLNKYALDDQQIIEDYLTAIHHIANQESRYLYVQGAKDCVDLLKKLSIL